MTNEDAPQVIESVALAEHITRAQRDLLLTGVTEVDPNEVLADVLAEHMETTVPSEPEPTADIPRFSPVWVLDEDHTQLVCEDCFNATEVE